MLIHVMHAKTCVVQFCTLTHYKSLSIHSEYVVASIATVRTTARCKLPSWGFLLDPAAFAHGGIPGEWKSGHWMLSALANQGARTCQNQTYSRCLLHWLVRTPCACAVVLGNPIEQGVKKSMNMMPCWKHSQGCQWSFACLKDQGLIPSLSYLLFRLTKISDTTKKRDQYDLHFPARNFCWRHWKPRVQNWMPHDTMLLHNRLDGSQVTLQALATGNAGNVRNVAFCSLGSHTPWACQPHSCRVMVTSPRISLQHSHMISCQKTIWKSETCKLNINTISTQSKHTLSDCWGLPQAFQGLRNSQMPSLRSANIKSSGFTGVSPMIAGVESRRSCSVRRCWIPMNS